jgi:ribosome-associated protein
MDIRKLQRAIVDGLEDVKAQNVVVFNTEHLTPLFERVIVASGASNRQTKALASSVRETVKSRGMDVLRTEGEANGEWIIVDCGAAVVHVMQPAIRDYYHLEELWGDKAVRMKIDAAPATLVKAAPDQAAPRSPEPTQRKVAARKAAPRKAALRKAAPRKAAPRKKASASSDGARQPLSQAAPGRKRVLASAAKKTAARPPAARKADAAKRTAKSAAPRAAKGAAPRVAKGATPRVAKGAAKPAKKR